jgi:hypothetical protein
MRAPSEIAADHSALNELLVNCPDFYRLEALLGGFNLFQVLKFEHGEIRHSNVLGWILDPAESHGLDDTFLKKWLMRVIHESADNLAVPIAPVDVDGWELIDVEVRREWRNIDLLLLLTLADGEKWVISIENKIGSAQHSDQLNRYRSIVEKEFPGAARRLFVFLTRNDESPEDETYITASYTQVHQALSECMQSRSHAIGSEPKVLLENYLRLLEEKFMDESEIARTAVRIYQQHRRALDVIFDHRPDNLGLVSEKLRKLLAENADHLEIIPEGSTKSYLRFIPKSWDQPGNSHGEAWSGSSRTVLFEMSLSGKRPYLYVIAGKAPNPWIDPIWQRVGAPPFHRPRRTVRPRLWCTLHVLERSSLSLSDEEIEDPTDMAQRLYEWCARSLQGSGTQEVIKILASELPKLHELHQPRSA